MKTPETEQKHDHKISSCVKAYHNAISPDWHMYESEERYQSTCAKAGKFTQKSRPIVHDYPAQAISPSALVDTTSAFRTAN